MNTNWKLGLGFTLLTVLMWGLLPIALKVVLEVMDPVTISWYRFSLSALIALMWYGYKRLGEVKALLIPPNWRLTAVAVGGLLCNYLLYIWGLDHITPGAAQILIQLAPLLLLIGSVILFKEGFSAAQWMGVIVLSVGMLLFFHQRLTNLVLTSDDYLTGILLIVGAAVTWAFYGLAQKKLMAAHNAKDLLFLICVSGTVLLLPISEPQQIRALNSTELALLLFCGLNTIIAYGSFGLAMSYWQSSRVSAVLPIAPLLTLLIAAGLNHWQWMDIPTEPLDWLGSFGALLVVAGAAVAALPRQQRNA
jgi:drug/metabolite transporter (DMT)-like permease